LKKTSILSIRLYEDEKTSLNTESQIKNITVNSLGRQIISKHVNWYRFTDDMHYIMITKSSLQILFEKADDIAINNMTSNMHNKLKKTAVFIYGENNIKNILSVIDMWLDACSIPFRHITDFHIEKYVINHNIGKNFSEYLYRLINSALVDVGHIIKNQTIDESCITFEIERVSEK